MTEAAVTPCIPPSEAELETTREHLETGVWLSKEMAIRFVTEIERLRALCGRAADEFPITGDAQGLRWELRAASKGEL